MDVFNKGLCLIVAMGVAVALRAAELSIDECRSKAATGDAEAQWQLGQRYEEGRDVKKNAIRAIAQYKKAAEQKHREACERLAELYSEGMLVRKDAVLAAKYRAWAIGDDATAAVQEASAAEKAANEDEIESALDYILGRNGKPKDPKAGIRILYQSAKDKPIAQRVFVQRWERGDLDDALEVLSNDEWQMVVPWFESAFAAGRHKGGLILGNDAYRKKQYSLAANYWRESGLAGLSKSWYFLGRFYWTWSGEDNWGAPQHMQSDRKAKEAFERALRLDSQFGLAKRSYATLCLFSKDKSCMDSQKAFSIFEEFYKLDKKDKWNVYYYGVSGYAVAWDAINKNFEQYKRAFRARPGEMNYDVSLRRQRECERFIQQKKHFVQFIDQAAKMGCEPAQKFMQNYKED